MHITLDVQDNFSVPHTRLPLFTITRTTLFNSNDTHIYTNNNTNTVPQTSEDIIDLYFLQENRNRRNNNSQE